MNVFDHFCLLLLFTSKSIISGVYIYHSLGISVFWGRLYILEGKIVCWLCAIRFTAICFYFILESRLISFYIFPEFGSPTLHILSVYLQQI